MSAPRFRGAPILVALAMCALSAVGVWRFFSSDSAQAEPPEAALYNFEGNVSYTRKGQTNPAAIDQPIQKGDSFKTGPESNLDLTFGIYAGVKLLADGDLTLTSVQKISLGLKLSKGTLMVNTKKLPSGMEIEIDTPNSIAEIRVSGTQFLIRVESDAKKPKEARVRYTVRKGPIQVLVKEANASVNVIDGLTLDVTPESYIPNARNWTEDEQASVRSINQIPIAIPDSKE